MRKRWILGVVGAFALFLAGCGGGDSVPPVLVFEQLSDQTIDAYISSVIDPVTGDPTIFPATGTGVIRIGVESSGVEYRGFLDFPIKTRIPYTANVQLAYVEVFVNSVQYETEIPVLVELVDFQPPVLLGSDFYRSLPEPFLPPVQGRSIFNFLLDDVTMRRPVRIDVTSLFQTALQRLQPDFQLRILLDPAILGPGIVQLDDNIIDTAPLLHVEYY